MKQWLENMTGSFSPSAKIVDGTLVLSLPNAVSPVVWRMDLGKTKSSAIEVREDENLYSLVLKTPQADIYKIARYESKLPATQALICIMEAMSKAQGQFGTAPETAGNRLPVVVPQTNNQKSFVGNTDAVCAANVICHVPDLNELIRGVDILLNKKGLFIFEEPYLGSMFEKISYDQIYDEHIFMFSVTSINKIFKLFEMELIDVYPQTTHGGSMRYIVGRKNNHKISNNVKIHLENEKVNNLDNISSCNTFKKKCELSKLKTRENLLKFKENNNKIAGYAATSKSTTILNYCNIDNHVIDYICDTTPEKIGKFSPGTHIPIVDMSHFKKFTPDVAYLFAWNHKDEIFKKEKNYKGKWFSHVSL